MTYTPMQRLPEPKQPLDENLPTAAEITAEVGRQIDRARARYNVGWDESDLRLTINPEWANVLKADAEKWSRFFHEAPIDTWRGIRWTVDSRVSGVEIAVVLR